MTTTDGFEAVFLETHNWGKAARFFQSLGFRLEFETDHGSGQLRNGDGPYVFIAEVPEGQEPEIQLVLKVADEALDLDPVVEVVSPFADTHWGTRQMTVRDPDGRLWSLEAPGGAAYDARRAVSGEPLDAPDSTAVRVALWRALHVELDDPPPVLHDVVGLRLADPAEGWRERPDMHPLGTRGLRAAIVARARFIEDLVEEQLAAGVTQYVTLGAGLDTLAQRRPDLVGGLDVFEIDQPGTQAWKRRRLDELGLGVPEYLHFVPIDFETGESWWDGLVAAGFDPSRPAVVASTGVAMYLSRETTAATLQQLAELAAGSTLAISFLIPIELVDEADRPGLEASMAGAKASGTPFASFYAPDDMVGLARAAGFASVRHVPSSVLAERYFAGRADGLRPSTGEDLLLATT